MKKKDEVEIFIFQDIRTTKLDWVEIYKETLLDQIMLSKPQRFSALGSSFYFKTTTKQTLIFVWARLEKSLIWQKFSST